ncbi:hypothetical protein CEUSTIGMA_g9369.t1 [Chlamydomonas eustigma]|uniref:Rab-GAP TBC domain-containing protein n=1 Tax=Chlamydomonas eustigma TaxID=1157962 RepID=A0A250XFU1_9CHLO|nr:hypothetical protein CEUSTIGMA_g9369.t1 [Chlamydomonas eustigma]|eukprot:GAX81941.1 hypothetical protein CEUSTIGMA_g9369.t1 [Chlamydomonas eustigma]
MSRKGCRRRKKKSSASPKNSPNNKSKSPSGEDDKERFRDDHETVCLIEDAIQPTVDIGNLRRLAVERGLVNRRLRKRCWPLLLGSGADSTPQHSTCEREYTLSREFSSSKSSSAISPDSKEEETEVQVDKYEEWHQVDHRDRHVVEVDVERSLWSFTEGMSDERRSELRQELSRVLNATVGRYAGFDTGVQVHYYQGLHDVASVLMMELGSEIGAFQLLSQLVVLHLRDCTKPSLEPVLELLQLVWPLLSFQDSGLSLHLQRMGLPAYFSLSWFITWFAHDVKALKVASRLFDFFLASHPLMPLYLGVSAMQAMRQPLLACMEMHEAHALLSHIDITGDLMPPLEELMSSAVRLMQHLSPLGLVERSLNTLPPMTLCVVPWATWIDETQCWQLPSTTPRVIRAVHQHQHQGLQRLLSRFPGWQAPGWQAPDNESALLSKEEGDDTSSSLRRGVYHNRKRPRVLMALSKGGMVSMYVVAAVIAGYAMVKGGFGKEFGVY